MNLFQRLSYLKEWHDSNHTLYSENRNKFKEAFSKKYKNELKRYTEELKRLKRKRAQDMIEESALSYQDWVERNFQKLLKQLSHTVLESKKNELLGNFDRWLKDFATLDYKFRVYSLELYYKVEIARYNAQFDRYIIALRDGQAEWLIQEDEQYNQWSENHPLYKELQELEYQYDRLSDDDTVGQNYAYNQRKQFHKNMHKFTKNYHPTRKENLTIKVEKPLSVKPYTPSYF